MATVNIDSISGLKCVENFGVVTSLTRIALVSGLTDTDAGVLATALAALTSAGHTVYSSPTDYPNVVLVKRSPEMVPDDNSKAIVTLEYEHFADIRGQQLKVGGEAYRERSTLEQVRTNKQSSASDASPIVLTYTYPDDHPTLGGQTVHQGGEIDVLAARDEIMLHGVISTDMPRQYKAFRGSVNSEEWANGSPRTWKCTNVEFEPFDRSSSPRKYFFEFLFQYKEEGWDPTAVFVDPETGRPPDDIDNEVNEETASVTIEYDDEIDFAQILNPDDESG